MKKILLSIVLWAMGCAAIFAQEMGAEERSSSFHFGFIYPVSSNGQQAYLYANKVSINLLVGVSNREQAFALAGLGNSARAGISGIAIAGLANLNGGETKGLTVAGLTNIVMQGASGSAVAGLANLNGGATKGLTVAGLANITRRGTKGIGVAGLANINGESSSGWTVTGGVNMTNGVYSGMQIAGMANAAGKVAGMQIAGLMNVAKTVRGVQLSGLVNVADSSDYPVGLINLIHNGEKAVALTYDELGNVIASFLSGSKTMYGIVGVGHGTSAGGASLVTEAGIGANVRLGSKLRLNNDLTSGYLIASRATFKSGYTLWLAWRAARAVEIAAGAGINYMFTNNTNNMRVFPSHWLWKNYSSEKLQQVFAGYRLSIRYVL